MKCPYCDGELEQCESFNGSKCLPCNKAFTNTALAVRLYGQLPANEYLEQIAWDGRG